LFQVKTTWFHHFAAGSRIHLMIRNEFVARFGAPAKRQWEKYPSWTTSDSAAAANNPPQTMCAAAAADSATTLSLNQL